MKSNHSHPTVFNLPQHFLGDAWTYAAEDRVHLFHLRCPDNIARHTRWSIGHASSDDMATWQDHGVLFESMPDDPLRSCLSTGSVTRFGDRYIMGFLANHNQLNPRVIYAVSDDLYQWQELPGFACDLHRSGYGRRGSLPFKNPRWRDPYLFVHDGCLHQLMTASDDRLPEEADGVIAHMRTRDLLDWEYLPALKLPQIGTDLECPKLYWIDGRWVLLVSMFSLLQSPQFRARQPQQLNANTTFCLVANQLGGPYEVHGDGRVLHTDFPGGPYACSALKWRGLWYLLGTCWSDCLGDRISDPIAVEMTQGGLRSQPCVSMAKWDP